MQSHDLKIFFLCFLAPWISSVECPEAKTTAVSPLPEQLSPAAPKFEQLFSPAPLPPALAWLVLVSPAAHPSTTLEFLAEFTMLSIWTDVSCADFKRLDNS